MKSLVRIFSALILLISIISVMSACEGGDISDVISGITGDTGNTNVDCPHLYGDWDVVKDGFCEDRTHQRTCQLCGEVERKEGSEDDHWWSDFILTPPTCVAGGKEERVCDLCGKTETKNPTAPTGEHTWLTRFTVDPTCDEAGKRYCECKDCDEIKTESFGEPTGLHSFGYYSYDDEYHYVHCYCGTKIGSGRHEYIYNSTYCDVCSYNSAKSYEIDIWVSEMSGMTELYEEQVERFAEMKGYTINYTISGVAEVDAGDQVICDVASAPDIYCFAHDQLPRLVQACALAKPTADSQSTIKSNNDSSSIKAASIGDSLYAYPITSDNGFFMYYDPSVITNPDSLEQIIADCEAAGKTIRFASDNGWYVSSFFFATGCVNEWSMDEDGKFTSVNDSFNSDAGLIAARGLMKLTSSPAHDTNADWVDANTAVWITGLWNHQIAMEYGLAATDLPCFTVDDNTYHMGSFSGNKLMGVKPQSDWKKAMVLEELALYLTGYECQMERYERFQWGPSNLKAQEATSEHSGLAALAMQAAFSTPQSNIHGGWWNIATTLGKNIEYSSTEADLKSALSEYEDAVNLLVNYLDKEVWSVIGFIYDSQWDFDYEMTTVGDGVWESEVLYFEKDSEFKVRKNCSWDVNFGSDGYNGGANYHVETAGNYIVRFTYLSDEYSEVELISVQ